MINLFRKLFGRKNVIRLNDPIATNIAQIDQIAKECEKKVNESYDKSLKRLNSGDLNQKHEAALEIISTREITQIYDDAIKRMQAVGRNKDSLVEEKVITPKVPTLEDAFLYGQSELYSFHKPADFAKVDYTFTADCVDGTSNAYFSLPHANKGFTAFTPRHIIPDKVIEFSGNRTTHSSLFIRKDVLANAAGSLENAVKQIPRSSELKLHKDGYDSCCYARVHLDVSSADGKAFDYVLRNQIKDTKPIDENLSYLKRLYAELGKEEIASHLGRRIKVMNANTNQNNVLTKKKFLDYVASKDNLAYAHPYLKTKLDGVDAKVSELALARDKELKTVNEMYGNLTSQSLTDKRNVVIAKYDPQIAELSENKYALAEPLRNVKEAIVRLGSSDIRSMPKEYYKQVNRAYRILSKFDESNN